MRISFLVALVAATTFAYADSPARHGLANGVYSVLREGPTREQASSQAASETVLRYDKKYSEADRTQPDIYVALDTSSFVPLILEGPVEAGKADNGWTLLQITLAREHVKTLELFTRAHLNGRVAIVIDGEIITIHKVRSVIPDGKVMITRCQDDACQVLKRKLTK